MNKDKQQQRYIKKYAKQREQHKKDGCKEVIGTLKARELREQGLKYCPRCKEIKQLTEFNKSKNSNKGYSSHCTLCSRELGKQYYNKQKRRYYYNNNKDRLKHRKLLHNFGITLEEYNNKLKKQGDKCMICGKTTLENGKSLAVDHNHSTGEIRDLLCANCNAAIGFLQENIVIAEQAVKYLKRWSK